MASSSAASRAPQFLDDAREGSGFRGRARLIVTSYTRDTAYAVQHGASKSSVYGDVVIDHTSVTWTACNGQPKSSSFITKKTVFPISVIVPEPRFKTPSMFNFLTNSLHHPEDFPGQRARFRFHTAPQVGAQQKGEEVILDFSQPGESDSEAAASETVMERALLALAASLLARETAEWVRDKNGHHAMLGDFRGALVKTLPTTEAGWCERIATFCLLSTLSRHLRPGNNAYGTGPGMHFGSLATYVQAVARSPPMIVTGFFGPAYRADLGLLASTVDRLNSATLMGQLDLHLKDDLGRICDIRRDDAVVATTTDALKLDWRSLTHFGIPGRIVYAPVQGCSTWSWKLLCPAYSLRLSFADDEEESSSGANKAKEKPQSAAGAKGKAPPKAKAAPKAAAPKGKGKGKAAPPSKTKPGSKRPRDDEEPELTGDAQSLHSGSDLISPNDEEWLNDAQIATAGHLESDPMRAARMVKTNYPRPSEKVPQLFGEPTAQKALASKSLTIVQQYCDGMHWHNLAIIGPTAQIVMWEPFGSRLGDRDAIMIAAKKAAAKASSSDKWGRTWKVKVLTLKLQDDGYQCGVWSHYFRGRIYAYVYDGTFSDNALLERLMLANGLGDLHVGSRAEKAQKSAANRAFVAALRDTMRKMLQAGAAVDNRPFRDGSQDATFTGNERSAVDYTSLDARLDRSAT